MPLLHFSHHTKSTSKTTIHLWIIFLKPAWNFHKNLLLQLKFSQQKVPFTSAKCTCMLPINMIASTICTVSHAQHVTICCDKQTICLGSVRANELPYKLDISTLTFFFIAQVELMMSAFLGMSCWLMTSHTPFLVI